MDNASFLLLGTSNKNRKINDRSVAIVCVV
jgi:hypothetical protein